MPTVPFLEAVQDVSAGNTKIPQSAFLDHGQLAIVDQGQQLIAGYTNDAGSRVKANPPVIVFGDHTRALKFIDFPFVMGADGVKVLRVREGFDPKFVYRFLESRRIASAGYSRHFKFLKEISVPKPSLFEQRRIAAILDHADALRAKRRQVLTHLESLTHSIFHEMFASGVHETRPLGDVTELRAGVGFPPRLQGRTAGDYPMAKVGDLGRVGRSTVDTIQSADHWVDESDLKVLKMTPVPAGSVLFAKIGEAIRHNHRVIAGRSLLLDNNAMAAIPGDPISTPYLFAYLKTVDFYALASSTTVPSLRKTDLAALRVPLPSRSEQSKFEACFARINTVRAQVQQAAISDDQLFAALQSRAFRGEL